MHATLSTAYDAPAANSMLHRRAIPLVPPRAPSGVSSQPTSQTLLYERPVTLNPLYVPSKRLQKSFTPIHKKFAYTIWCDRLTKRLFVFYSETCTLVNMVALPSAPNCMALSQVNGYITIGTDTETMIVQFPDFIFTRSWPSRSPVTCMAISQDHEAYLATGSTDGEITLIVHPNTQSPETFRTKNRFSENITSMAFVAKSQELMVGTVSGLFSIYHVKSLQLKIDLHHFPSLSLIHI